MGIFNITPEMIVRLKFKSYLDSVPTEKQDAWVKGMIEDESGGTNAVAASLSGQVEELEGRFKSLTDQATGLTTSITTIAGKAAAVAANTANPFAATASLGMIVSMIAAVKNLMSNIKALVSGVSQLKADTKSLVGFLPPPFAALDALMAPLAGAEEPQPPPVPDLATVDKLKTEFFGMGYDESTQDNFTQAFKVADGWAAPTTVRLVFPQGDASTSLLVQVVKPGSVIFRESTMKFGSALFESFIEDLNTFISTCKSDMAAQPLYN